MAFRRVLLLLFLLHLVPRREDPTSPISNRDFKGFREDYSVKVIIFEDTIASRSLILPIFFFFYRELYTRVKEIVIVYTPCERNYSILFLEMGGTIKFERWILSTDDLERIERRVGENRVYFLWKIIHRLGGCK